jgi:hypothetical protein
VFEFLVPRGHFIYFGPLGHPFVGGSFVESYLKHLNREIDKESQGNQLGLCKMYSCGKETRLVGAVGV